MTPDTTQLEVLAHQIVAGDYSGLPQVDYEYHTTDEWLVEAQRIVDGDAPDDLEWMLVLEVAHNRYAALPERDQFDWFDSENYAAEHRSDLTQSLDTTVPALMVGVAA